MSTNLEQAFISNTAPRTLKVYTENEAVIGVEPIEEVYPYRSTNYVAGSILQWKTPVNSRVLAFHFNENADITGGIITLGASLENGTILFTYTLNVSDFTQRGNTYTFEFPSVFIEKDWIFGLVSTVNIQRIAIVAKRVAILPSVAPL